MLYTLYNYIIYIAIITFYTYILIHHRYTLTDETLFRLLPFHSHPSLSARNCEPAIALRHIPSHVM